MLKIILLLVGSITLVSCTEPIPKVICVKYHYEKTMIGGKVPGNKAVCEDWVINPEWEALSESKPNE